MIKTVDHIGIAVKNVEEAGHIFEDVFGARLEFKRQSPALGATSAKFTWGDKEVTLNEPIDQNGPIGRFVARRGEGIEHIAVEVDDVEAVVAKLEAHGVHVFGKSFDGEHERGALVHPKDFFGILLQLVEWWGECKHSMEARVRFADIGGVIK